MSLTLGVVLDRPLYVAEQGGERYLMLTVQAAGCEARRPPMNLALAIDTSGSMHGSKLARAREAAGLVVRHLTGLDRVALVTYDDDARAVAPSTILTGSGKTELLYQISRIEAGGWTNLGAGWILACEQVASEALACEDSSSTINRVLLLSDGLANVGITDTDELIERARQLAQGGVATSTLGLGADFNGDLLESLARHGRGRFQYVESARQLPDCIQGELGELLHLAARGVAVDVTLPPGIAYHGCLNDYPTEVTGSGVRIRLGDLASGEARRIVLSLMVEPSVATNPVDAVRALAMFTDLRTGRGQEIAFPEARFCLASGAEVDRQMTGADVEREVALLSVAYARKEAIRLSVLGDRRSAAEVLVGASQRLQAIHRTDEPAIGAEINALTTQASQAQRGFTAAHQQELRYQAYLLREARSRYDLPH